jgi:membrane protease YdiL (CAAX protease family)
LTRSTVLAVLLAATCFVSYHIHFGPGRNLIFLFFMGLLFGCLYVWQRRLWPLVMAHTFINISISIGR